MLCQIYVLYFFPARGLSIHFLDGVFAGAEVLNFGDIQLTVFNTLCCCCLRPAQGLSAHPGSGSCASLGGSAPVSPLRSVIRFVCFPPFLFF